MTTASAEAPPASVRWYRRKVSGVWLLLVLVVLVLGSVKLLPGLYERAKVPVLDSWACQWSGDVWVSNSDYADHVSAQLAFQNGPGCYSAP